MARLNLFVPDELYAEMKRSLMDKNWSAIAQRAFQIELAMMLRGRARGTRQVVHRLQGTKAFTDLCERYRKVYDR